ncbi:MULTISPECIES: AMP-binding protein [unclassified Frankia]|uniref:class I adenylate-forming enzyme family protein n=1 Tax=unclassified Frankia TaxID=2632575 RepID=UPI0027DAF292|nr:MULTISPECIES: AMP-binding protein [unclassified Frankia]
MTRARTVAEALDAVLADAPDRPAVVGPSGMLTYAGLDAAADAAAGFLAERGVRPGDRVAAALPNDLDIVVAFHAVARLGAVWVGLGRALARPEKDALLAVARPALVLVDPAGYAAEREPRTTARAPGRPSPLLVDPADPSGDWAAGLRAHAGEPRRPAPDPDLPAAIAFTSGTTGLPRGVVHSQRNLLLPAAALAADRGYDESLRKGDCLPLTILNLVVLTTLLTSAAGGCCVLTDRRDARGVAAWIERESVTVWNGVPALLHSLLHDPEITPERLASLTEVWSGGANCPEELRAAFRDRFGVPVCATYGLTEAPTVVTIDPPGRHIAGASGVPLPHLDVRVVDDEGAPVPTGELGEVLVRAAHAGPWQGAYTPMLGEWTSDGLVSFQGSELRTGDIGRVDGDGWLSIHDRLKLLIMRGGANIYPAEVERVLAQVDGVREAVALGLPDPRLGQRVVAVVEVTQPGATDEETCVAHCRASLARYKVPERVLVLDALPRNAMGKPLRAALPPLFASAPEREDGARTARPRAT